MADTSQINIVVEDCIAEGMVIDFSFGKECCDGLTPIRENGNYICKDWSNCGDTVCGPGEAYLNCPEDCEEEFSCPEGYIVEGDDCVPKLRTWQDIIDDYLADILTLGVTLSELKEILNI